MLWIVFDKLQVDIFVSSKEEIFYIRIEEMASMHNKNNYFQCIELCKNSYI
jgi:hypothetical protein